MPQPKIAHDLHVHECFQGLSSRVLQQQAVELQETFYAAAETRGLQEDQKLGGDSANVPFPSQQQWVVEQLCALCKLPSADAEAKLSILHFLALHAFLRLDPKSTKKVKGCVKMSAVVVQQNSCIRT